MAAHGQWLATILDIRTAFLNAKEVQSEGKDLLLVRRPFLFIEKKFLRKDVLYKPEKAIYGFKGSPRLWGLTRDETLVGFNIQGEHEGKLLNFVLELLQCSKTMMMMMMMMMMRT